MIVESPAVTTVIQLRLSNVVKSYDGATLIVKGVSLDVAEGEFLTILGPSGCGKSTLLRVIAGLERADAGDVEIAGRRVNDLEPRDRDIAMVFQSYALYPHMSVFDNIAVALKLRGVRDIRPRVEDAARRLGIDKHLSRRPKELSGGERQRVALARALVREPKLFLLDEPLSNLDALLRERARAELKSLFKALKATVVYVTHDQVEAMTLSDRVAVMNAGRVEQLAPPQDVYARPATLFVAGFVGSPRMNLLPDGTGIRPEDVVVGEGPIAAAVTLREPLGAHHLLTLKAPAFELRAIVAADWSGGPDVRIALPPERTHRFDTDGRRIP